MTEITMKPVLSDTIDSYYYDEDYQNLFLHFKSGGFYLYHDCPKALAMRFEKQHPWRRIHADVKALPFDRVSKGIKTGPKIVKKKTASKAKVTAKVKK